MTSIGDPVQPSPGIGAIPARTACGRAGGHDMQPPAEALTYDVNMGGDPPCVVLTPANENAEALGPVRAEAVIDTGNYVAYSLRTAAGTLAINTTYIWSVAVIKI